MAKLTADKVRSEIGFFQPELEVSQKGDLIILSGSFVVSDASGKASADGPLTRFDVRIGIPDDFPDREPRVFETGGRIPREMDRHIFPSVGACCITIWETWLVNTKERTVEAYLSGPVNNYFFSQLYFEEKQKWPLGEWKHGIEGVVDAYAKILDCKAEEETIRQHLKVLKLEWPKGHLPCPCGSGERLRNCHSDKLSELHEFVPPKMAAGALETLDISSDVRRRAA